MKTKYIYCFMFISVFFAFTTLRANSDTYYRYWNDSSSYTCSSYTRFGAGVHCRWGDVDNLGEYVSTSIFQVGSVTLPIDGGYYDSSPWTLSGYYYTYVEWYFTGYHVDDGDGPSGDDRFYFVYDLYYLIGSTHITVLSNIKEYDYDGTQNWNNGFESHYLGGATYDYTKTYYLKCTIYVNRANEGTTDFYYGADKLDFYRVRFYYPGGE